MAGENYLLSAADNVYGMRRRIDILAALQSAENAAVIVPQINADTPGNNGVGFTDLSFGKFSSVNFSTTDNQNMCVFISGVKTQAAGEGVWNGYTGTGTPFSIGPYDNDYLVGIATDLFNRLSPFISRRRNVWIVGYSAGGVVGEILRRLILASAPDTVISLTGVGSPKFQKDIDVRQGQGDETYLITCDDDPVPLIPPSVSVWDRVMAGLNYWQGERIQHFKPWPSGTNIDPTGGFTGGASPARLPTPPLTAIGSWLNQANQGVLTVHSIEVYQARISLATGTMSAPPATAPVAPPAFNPAPATVAVIRGAITTSQQTIFTDGNRQNANPVVIPDDRLFTARRRGKVWRVYFGDVEIATAPKRKRALALKNEGNAFIRRLQNEAIVNADALAQCWSDYLAVASDPTSGFVPALNTEP
jgi:hypothetical protein